MGIAKGAVSLLYELKKSENFKGAVCQLGKQSCYVSESQVRNIAKNFGFTAPLITFVPSKTTQEGMVDDCYLFRTLGFDTVESIDADDYEQATHILDLNTAVPEEFYERYDAIYDGGTLEHVFNLPMSLKNIYRMLKPGGIVMHALPSNNHVDHGFYQFSPTLFYDYYSVNKWEILKSNIFEYSPEHATKPWLIYNYEPGAINHLSYGRWGSNMLGIWFVARKSPESRCDLIPMQGTYIRTWAQKLKTANAPEIQSKSYGTLIKRIIKSNKYSHWIALSLNKQLRKIRNADFQKPKVVAKY